MKTTFLLSTTRRGFGFQTRYELLSVLLKSHTIPSQDVWPSLFGFLVCTKTLASMILRWERSSSFPSSFLYGVSTFRAECGIQTQMYEAAIMSSPQRNGGINSPLSTRMHRTIAHSVRPTHSKTMICCGVLVAVNC